MFESARLEHVLDKEAFDAVEPALRTNLLDAQFDLIEAKRHAIMVVLAGPDGAGKGEVLNRLYEWLDAAANARLVKNAEQYYRIMYYGSAGSWNLRDTHMFETLCQLLDAKGPASKAVVWAHNSHIGNAAHTEMGQVREELNIGQLVKERFGDDKYALMWLAEHVEYDDAHPREALELIKLTVRDADDRAAVKDAVRRSLELFRRGFDACAV